MTRRRSGVIATFVTACCAVSIAQQSAPPAGDPAPTTQPAQAPDSSQTFRSNIDVVSLSVTVSDSAGHYVNNLTEGDFLVFENGVKQDTSFFSHRQAPLALPLLLDTSSSMDSKLPTLQAAASSFVDRLKPDDMAQIIEFNSTQNVRQDYTTDHAALRRAIQQLRAGGSTSLNNAIYVALKGLKKVQSAPTDENPRRQALIVFSDGTDTSSLIPFEEVLELAKRSETAIYTIGLRDAQDQVRGFSSSEFVLRQLSLDTGGRSFFPNSIDDLAGVYGQIADEIASQYALAYMPKNARHDGTYRRIVVQVSKPNLTSRTKQGYYAPTNR